MKPKRPIEKVGIITKSTIKSHEKCLKALVRYLKKHKKEIIFDENSCKYFKKSKGHKKAKILTEADLIIIMGGDGTILKTARSMGRKKVYVLGINFGNLGFLTECAPDKIFDCLDKIFEGKFYEDKRSLLRVTVYRKNKKLTTELALNDAVINQGSFARLISMKLEINNRKVVDFKADGMIVATPTGSTAHSLSAGGPIVHQSLDNLIITPICPRSLSMRPIVLPSNRQLTVTIDTQRNAEASDIGLTIDGQDMLSLKYGDKIKFRRSKRYLYLTRLKNNYYRILRSKLNWGE